MDSFCPSWKDLLHPVRLTTKESGIRYTDQVEPETPCYVHLGIRMLEPTELYPEKINQILDKEVVYKYLFALNTESIDEIQLDESYDFNLGITLKPDYITAENNEVLKLNVTKCLQNVLEKIPAKELAEHGIIVQTYRIEVSEFGTSYYQKRVDEIVTEFMNKTIVYNNCIRSDNIMQVFLYEGYAYRPGRLFTKFCTQRSREHIGEILKYFIENFNQLNELEQLTELLYLEHYNLTQTIYSVLKHALTKSISQRSFYRNITSFMQSPCYTSATQGLQLLCRQKLVFYMIKGHVKWMLRQLRRSVQLSDENEEKLLDIFMETCYRILLLAKGTNTDLGRTISLLQLFSPLLPIA